MENYIGGFIKNISNRAVTLFSFVDSTSIIDKKSKLHRFTKVRHSTIGKYSFTGVGVDISYAHIGKLNRSTLK